MILSSRLLSQQVRLLSRPRSTLVVPTKRHGVFARPLSRNAVIESSVSSPTTAFPFTSGSLLVAATLLCTAVNHIAPDNDNASLVQCSAPLGAEPVMLSPEKESATGILFPRLCNGMTLAGCGVRVKWGFVKVYAVGSYFDPLAMSMIKSQGEAEVKKALLDPSYPRTIRIVMNRNLSIDKYTAAIIEALEPRMNGQDLESLVEFQKLNPKVDLVEGAEMEMTIRGDVLLYKNAVGGLGQIKSAVFTKALCDVYYGDDAVSPTHLKSVVEGVKNL
eukprot:CAMPEP_0183702562 /NCGR_PEP_ID=MMETSP0737-20130205/623_1 /TAXON_ID=385413 /ORGANISM="Thalassiosira miniscula, Strain CCMP1093" /LENGTH=274 /DNA_ID=CAMNT_0025929191 /DNA_START=36 /DNA_END=860 /DNA_ORIENTATION=+